MAEKIDILGVPISAIDLDCATQLIHAALEKKSRGYICPTSVHGIIEAQDDPAYLEILKGAFLCTPDGMPLVWAGRFFHGRQSIDRVYGPDLLWEIFRTTENLPLRHFLYGGGVGVAQRLAERLEAHFPGSTIAGIHTPPFRPLTAAEETELQKLLENTKPDIIWVGLGTPKQEAFMATHFEKGPATLMIGIGAAFDLHAGLIQQAPTWLQRHGLEWFYRLTREPARLWPRYRRIIPRFLYLFIKEVFRS